LAIKDSIFLITHRNCAPCKKISEHLKGKIPVYDLAESDDAFDLVQKGLIGAVPAALARVGSKYEKCKIQETEDGKSIIIKCPNTDITVEK